MAHKIAALIFSKLQVNQPVIVPKVANTDEPQNIRREFSLRSQFPLFTSLMRQRILAQTQWTQSMMLKTATHSLHLRPEYQLTRDQLRQLSTSRLVNLERHADRVISGPLSNETSETDDSS